MRVDAEDAVRLRRAIARLARQLNTSMLSRVLGRLEELGLIDRSPDPEDLRSVSVSVTADGRTVHARIKTQRAEAVSNAATRLSGREQQALIDALDALDHLADEL